MRTGLALAVASACGVLTLAPAASAQAPGQAAPPAIAVTPVEHAPAVRTGFVIGIALGPGSIAAIDSSSGDTFDGFSVNLHAGGLINPRLAVVVDLWSVVHENDNFGAEITLTHNIVTVAAKYWVTPRFWLAGGIGRASYTVIQDGNTYDSDDVPALMGAAGAELSRSRTFSLDLQARVGAADYDEGELRNGAVVLGLNWY